MVTGSRAEYGLLRWLMQEIAEQAKLKLQLIVTGMHLAPELGQTYRLIEEDGFVIDEKVEMLLASDTPVGVTKSLGLGVIGFADALERLKPDIVVLLGDRFEILATAQAALIAKIPVAHIHGGERSEGAFDEGIRHAVTKMSHLHFVANEEYRQRVIQLGEPPERVYNFGAIGLDALTRIKLLSLAELAGRLGFSLEPYYFVVTYHPVTLADENPDTTMREMFSALDRFPEAKIIFTKPNADSHGRQISRMIDSYVATQPRRAIAFTSMGQVNYLSAVAHSTLVLGNSSSGLIEVPAFHKPTINLGKRQAGRAKAGSVIDCEERAEEISEAIRKALSPQFRENLRDLQSPYGFGDASRKIVKVLTEIPLTGIVVKKFYDLQ